MSFLTPLFLLGAAAMGLPILFHLTRRSTKERLPFGSLMFLSLSPPRISRRSRLEHILLLLLRCAVICLIAFAFARPFLKNLVPLPNPAAGKRVLVLLDASASMRRGDLWAQAKKRVATIAAQASAGDQFALFTFDRHLKPLLTFEEWASAAPDQRATLAESKMQAASPGWASTSLGQVLMSAADRLAEGGESFHGASEVILVSDMQEGARLEPLQGYEWPKGLQLSVERVELPQGNNASIQLVASGLETDTHEPGTVRVRVVNNGVSKKEAFLVGWARGGSAQFLDAPRQVYVPAGQSRVVSLDLPATTSARPAQVLLTGDDQDFDNTVFVARPEAMQIYVAYIGTELESDPKAQLYFLNRAFQETRRQAVAVRKYTPEQPIPPSEALETTLFVIGGTVSEERSRELRALVERGKTLLFVLTKGNGAAMLDSLIGKNVEVREAQVANHVLLANLDFNHPLFAPFADPRYSDFTRIHFWRYRVVDAAEIPGSRVLAKFDGGDPAVVEFPLGKGRVIMLTSGWSPQDSQLALSTKFVPLLYSVLEHGGAPLPPPPQWRVGDEVPLGNPARQAKVRLPDDSEVELDSGSTYFTQANWPGVYRLESAQGVQQFAVNLDPMESRTAPVRADMLESLGAPVARTAAAAAADFARQTRLQNSELESRQKLWRWIIVGTLAVVLLETWLSMRAAGREGAAVPTAG